MTATSYAPHTFEPIFGAAAASGSAGRRKPALTEADLASARAEGHAAGQREAMAQTERATAESLRAIARMMQMSLGRLGAEAQSLRDDAVEVAMAAARAVAGRALEKCGADTVAEVFEEAAGLLRSEPRFLVRVAPEQVEVVEAALAEAAVQAGVAGQITVRPDPAAQAGDCAIEWDGGTLQRDRTAAFEAIEAAAQAWAATAEAEGFQLDLFQT